MGTRIGIENLVKVFGSGQSAARAVDGISVTIEPGELFFLLGPSGCGKTTLLRMIAGFIDPTSGTIAFDGRDVTHAPPNKRNTGMVFQSYALWPHMTVAQNVAFGLNIRKVAGAEKDKLVAEALDAVQMGPYVDRKPTQLSGGQQQRVAIARAIASQPAVVLADEPTANVDSETADNLLEIMERLNRNHDVTFLFSTHDPRVMERARRVVRLVDGQVDSDETKT